MECSPYYESDVLAYFDGHAEERALYEAFFRRLCAQFPACSVKVQKSQISFYNRISSPPPPCRSGGRRTGPKPASW